MIHRFPREKEDSSTHSIKGYSMMMVWNTLDKILVGKKVSKEALTLAQRWLGVEEITPYIIKQYARKGFDGHFRFPRRPQ